MSFKKTTLLTTNNFKTSKGEKVGYKTYILFMSPFTDNSKGINICPHASKGCAAACLVNSGFGGMFTKIAEGRRNKTEYFLGDRATFLLQLDAEILLAKVKNIGGKIAIRLNGTSDIRWEKFKVRDGKTLFELHPDVQFYDYTKNHLRFTADLPKNYHLTFSRAENNHAKAMELLKRGFNVAMVFNKVPSKYEGYKVIDGDENDLRFTDPKGVIVGLRYKKMTNKGADNSLGVKSGFVIDTEVLELVK